MQATVLYGPRDIRFEERPEPAIVGLTAWQALIERANLKKGQRVVVNDGSGFVGTFAIQLAKHVDATVATTTSTANVDLVRSLGADIVIEALKTIMGVLSYGIRSKVKRRHATYSFLFMRTNGEQLARITTLIDDGIIRPVVDRVFPFASTKEAMAYVEAGRAKGNVLVSMTWNEASPKTTA